MRKIISLWTALCVALLLLPQAALGALNMEELIYDINSGCFTTTGSWPASGAVKGYNDGPTNYGVGEGTARWTPDLFYGGTYRVSIWNVAHETNTSLAKVEVHHKNGVTEFTYDNQGGESGFLEIGEFEFDAGTSGYIEVIHEGEGFLRLNSVKYELLERGEQGQRPVPGTGEEEPYPDYVTREISTKEVSLPQTAADAVKIYVEPGKNGDGSEENPLGSLEAAQEKVRELIAGGYPQQGIGVYLNSGVYQLEDTLRFTQEDSGTAEHPVIWQAAPSAQVTITGGKELLAENFAPVDSVVEERLPQEGKGKVYVTDLSLAGIEDIPEMDLRNSVPYVFTIGGQAGHVSRWPNEGYGKTGKLIDSSSREDSGPRKKGFTYEISDPRPLRWEDNGNIWMNGYWMTPYTIDYARVAQLDKDQMRISGKEYNGLGSYGDARYYVENLLEEIDQEGEWYVDTNENKLYVYPFEGWEEQTIMFAPKNFDMLQFAGQNVIFRGVTLEVAGGNGVTMDQTAESCGVIGCEIRNVSGVGASINGTGCYVRDCDISYTGKQGIVINGGDQYYLVPGENYAENNKIHDTGTGGGQKQGITIGGCGNRVSHNHIYNIPTHGINGGGMEIIIEYNVVERTNLEMGDTGAIYFLNYGMGYGTKIRYNLIRDSVGLMPIPGFSGEGALGIYLDDVTSGVEVYGNLVMHCKERAIFSHGGRYNKIYNNIIIGCDGGVSIVKTSISKSIAEGSVVETNIKTFPYDEEPMKSKYPQVAQSLSDGFGEPKYVEGYNNVLYASGEFSVGAEAAAFGTFENNISFDQLPEGDLNTFYDFDYSQIHQQIPDFEELPIREMGIYQGGARTDTQTVVFDNRAEAFSLTYPVNGATNVDPATTLKWTQGGGGVRTYTIYVAEDEAFEQLVDYTSVTEGSYDINLEYGKTYYWRVKSEPMQGYEPRWNEGGVFSFTTMSLDDKLQGEILSAKSVLNATDEGGAAGQFPKGSKETLNSAIAVAQAAAAGEGEVESALQALMQAKQDYMGKRIPNTQNLATYIYDDYSLDTIGQRPLGLFFRSYNMLNVSVEQDPVNSKYKAVRFVDSDDKYQFGMRYFDSQSGYVEAGSSVLAAQTNGAFSVSLMKTGIYPVESGVVNNTAAAVIFGADGTIYADKNKTVALMPYEANTWYDVKIVLRLEDKNYDVYIDGEKMAEKVAMADTNITEVNQIVYHSTEASDASLSAQGTFYFTNSIVRAPLSEGKNSYLNSLQINGQMPEGFEPGKMVYEVDLTQEELRDAQVEYECGENAKVTVWDGDGRKYITVVAADFSKAFTYLIKCK